MKKQQSKLVVRNLQEEANRIKPILQVPKDMFRAIAGGLPPQTGGTTSDTADTDQ